VVNCGAVLIILLALVFLVMCLKSFVADSWLLTSQAAHGPTDVAGEAATKLTSAEERWRSPGHSLYAGN